LSEENLKEKIEKLKALKILFVEDEKNLREIIGETFTKLEVQFDTAENGQIALEMIKEHPYDLVVTDINMPVMNGLDLIENIRNTLDLHIPVYIMSAHTEQRYIDRAKELEVENYIMKPFDFIKFINMTYETKFAS
jgi:YesN/AraC family two-component response regulator